MATTRRDSRAGVWMNLKAPVPATADDRAGVPVRPAR